MRIVHVVEATFAGVGRHVLDLSREQARRGHVVHVVYSPERESSAFAADRSRSTEVTWHPVPFSRGIGWSDVRSLGTVRRLIRQDLKPDVIHGHSTKGGLVARLLGSSARVAYTPNAVYSMNPSLGLASRRLVAAAESLLSRRTDAIFAVSPEERSHLVDIGIDEARIRLVPNGVNPPMRASGSTLRDELGVGAHAPIVGFVGRLDHQKAPERLARIMLSCIESRPDLHAVIVGDGPLRGQLEEEILAGPTGGENIHVLGERPGRWAMESFDALLLPSRYEGFPYVLIEATQAGVPVVTTVAAGASQLVTNAAVGSIHEQDDLDGMVASALRHVSETDEPHREQIRRVGLGFTIEAMTDGVLNALGRLDP